MNIEIKVKIETEQINFELTQAEARALYEELKLMFEVKETIYIPYTNPLIPTPWQPVQPYYIGDIPSIGYPPHITYSCGSTHDNNTHEGIVTSEKP